jgi:hypothetical protein
VKEAGKKAATVSKDLAPVAAEWPVSDIREQLKKCAIEFGDKLNQF